MVLHSGCSVSQSGGTIYRGAIVQDPLMAQA